jgi:hypothetical protein
MIFIKRSSAVLKKSERNILKNIGAKKPTKAKLIHGKKVTG